MEERMRRRSITGITGTMAAAGGAALSAYLLAVRPWHLRWGAMEEEVREELPGEAALPES
jgi:hypothetical protein